MLRSPHLAEAVSLVALFVIRTCLNFTADGTLKKRPAGYTCSDANKAKEKTTTKKPKGSDVFKEATTNYDVTSRRVPAITSVEGFVRNQPVLRSVVMCLSLIHI